MMLFRNNPFRYVHLGKSRGDRLAFMIFGFIAPPHNRSCNRCWRIFSRFVPMLWLRPIALGGRKVLIDPTDWSQTLIFDEIFIARTYEITQFGFVPETIIDCGAHIGMFSLVAAAAFPQANIVAFEPNPNNAAQIRKQISKNGLTVKLIESAVSINSSERYFHVSNSHHGRLVESHDEGAFQVSTTDLPEMLERLKPTNLLIKIDIEGEEEILLPAIVPLLPKDCAVFFETHSGIAGWEKIKCLLSENGFGVRQINARGLFYDGFASRVQNADVSLPVNGQAIPRNA